jgi:putative ABC transport system permease protein
MNALWQDFRFAIRSLARSPIFAMVAILSLGLGIGANTAIFSLLDQLLLRMLPVKDPARIVQMAARGPHYGSNWGLNAMSYPMYRDFRDRAGVFEGLLCRQGTSGSLGYGGQVERVRAEMVSGNYFQVLGVAAALGRPLLPEDDERPGGHPVVVLSYDYWKSRFGADPNIVNGTVVVNNQPFTVLGVAAEGFYGVELGSATQIFVPVAMQERMIPGMKLLEDRRTRTLQIFGRLKPGVSLEQANAAVQPLYKQVIEMEVREQGFARASREARDRFLASNMTVFKGGTGQSYLRRQFGNALRVLMALVGFVLLIACANLANLQLARGTARQKEIAIRLALGAGRGQIIRQLLVESMTLSVAGGLGGLLVARWSVAFLLRLVPTDVSRLTFTPEIGLRLLLFNLGVSMLVGILFGLAPALQATRADLLVTLKDQAGSVATGVHAIFRKTLVVAQVSFSLLLLVGAGLFVHSLYNLHTLNPGFRAGGILMFNLDPSANGYTTERTRSFHDRLLETLRALPGVEGASGGAMALVSGYEMDSNLTVEGYEPKPGENVWAYNNWIGSGYFSTLGIRLVSGRDFGPRDAMDSPRVVIINERFARQYFPGRDPVGRRIGMGSDPGTRTDIEVIGVVQDFKYQDIREEIGRQFYRPYQQTRSATSLWYYVRASGKPEAMVASARNAVRNLDPNLPVVGVRTLDEQVVRNLSTERLVASLSTCFGALATVIAVIGLYGVMAFLVGRRSREIGIRMALGAGSGSVVWLIMGEVLVLVGIGACLGIAGSLALSRFVQAQLYGVTPNDPRAIAAATAVLALVACAAGFLPARRASRLDPLRVLRHE